MKRLIAERQKKRMPGIINAVELGPGPKPADLLRFAKKKGRKLHGIDIEAPETEQIPVKGGSTVEITRGDFHSELEKDYKPNSVKYFQMKMVISAADSLWTAKSTPRYGKLFRLVFDRLVPGGRFKISEAKRFLEEAIPELAEVGFKVKIFRPAKKEEITTYWQHDHADSQNPELWPWILVVSKPRK
ncbi:MAG: hypothetical protein NT067_06865 [Candidatus Diapherotrites archaeon]|nr:hypothetical protein [Candidatus Diapherotrites archaeon]